ncbi:Ubiquinone biosynthesis monooxygenase UbiB [Mesorhizobium loti]|nr:Ubiquinone biosynthesis monooxygenase UbiB [Mesorhizobium loti]
MRLSKPHKARAGHTDEVEQNPPDIVKQVLQVCARLTRAVRLSSIERDGGTTAARVASRFRRPGVDPKSVSRLIALISGSFEEVSAFGWLEQMADIAESLAEGIKGSGRLLSQPRLEF